MLRGLAVVLRELQRERARCPLGHCTLPGEQEGWYLCSSEQSRAKTLPGFYMDCIGQTKWSPSPPPVLPPCYSIWVWRRGSAFCSQETSNRWPTGGSANSQLRHVGAKTRLLPMLCQILRGRQSLALPQEKKLLDYVMGGVETRVVSTSEPITVAYYQLGFKQ